MPLLMPLRTETVRLASPTAAVCSVTFEMVLAAMFARSSRRFSGLGSIQVTCPSEPTRSLSRGR